MLVEKRDGFGGNGSALPMVSSQLLPQPGRNPSFARGPAYAEIEARMGDGCNRQTLHELRLLASCGPLDSNRGIRPGKPPAAPVRSGVLLVVIAAIDGDESSGEDVVATLADDTGEFSATLHAALLAEHPGCVAVRSEEHTV